MVSKTGRVKEKNWEAQSSSRKAVSLGVRFDGPEVSDPRQSSGNALRFDATNGE
jgi:hypothetical protein